MQKNLKTVLSLLLAGAMISALAMGCGKGKSTSSVPEDSVISAVSSAAASKDASAAVSVPAASASSAASSASLPAAPASTASLTNSTKGEGINVIPGTDVSLASNAASAEPGKELPVPSGNPSPSYTITVSSIAVTDKRNKDYPDQGGSVIRVTYTYANKGGLSSLMVGQTAFKLLGADGKALETYLFDVTSDSEAAAVLPVEKGSSATGAIGFLLPKGASGKVTLVFDDQIGGSGTEYYWTASV